MCDDCKHIVPTLHLQEVEGEGFFCPEHKRPYERYKRGIPNYRWGSMPTRYFKEIEVDKEGEPVGYTKIKEKKV